MGCVLEPNSTHTSCRPSQWAKNREERTTMKYVANGPTFVIVYVIAMIPTYLLPYVGSNSFAMNSAGSALGVGISPQFFMHLIALLILCAIG